MQQTLEKVQKEPITQDQLAGTLQRLIQKYEQKAFAFGLYKIGGGYQFLSKPAYEPIIAAFVQESSKKRLSRGLMETLSIVAYKQPVSKQEIEHIRGVHTGYALDRLLERELITISGRDDSPGRPLRYSTTQRFMDFFGINSLKDLPTLQEHSPDDTPQKNKP